MKRLYPCQQESTAVPHEPSPNKEAIRMLERAVGLDLVYALAWDALGQRYYFDALYSDGGEAAFYRSDAALERAKTLDPGLISAAGNLSTNHVERGELDKAYTEGEELVKRRPENGLAHFSLAYILRYAGLLKESQRECDTALGLDPGNYQFRSCARTFFLDGNYQRAMEYLALDAGSNYSKRNELEILLRRGRKTEALEKVHPLGAENLGMRLVEACLEERSASEIETLSKSAQSFAVSDPELRYATAGFEAFCGKNEAELGLLRQAVTGGYCSYPAIDSDPLRPCAIPPSSKKSVPQQWIAKRSSWLTVANSPSGCLCHFGSMPTRTSPSLSKPRRRARSCNSGPGL